MSRRTDIAMLGLLLVAPYSMAGVVAGADLGGALGVTLGNALSAVLGAPVGTALPLGIGGIAGIAALSLVLGIQLIKRKK